MGRDISDNLLLLKEKVSALYESVTQVCDVDALVLGPEYSGYIFPEIYDSSMGSVAKAVVIDFESDSVCAICNPLQATAIQDSYPSVALLLVDPSGIVDIGIPSFKNETEALRKALEGRKRVAYAGRLQLPPPTEIVAVNVDPIVKIVRMRKLNEEVKRIKKAIEIAECALNRIVSEISNGLSEIDIVRKLVDAIYECGGEGEAFPTIVAIGKGSREPHHIPTRGSVFSGREPILIDFGARFRGYRSDLTRMIVPKNLAPQYSGIHEVIDAVSKAIDAALKVLRPGVKAKEVFEEARRVLELSGNLDKEFLHGLGHGLGIDVHEEPYLSHRWEGNVVEGCVVTIEPGVYLHEFGVRIEEDVLVSESGSIKLSRLSRVIEL